MEPNDNYKLYMQGSGDNPQKGPPPPPPSPAPPIPQFPPSEPGRRYTEDKPLPDAIEPEEDWDRK